MNYYPVISSLIVLFCISAKEVSKLYFFLVFASLDKDAEFYAALWVGLMVFFATYTGYLTDRMAKKTVLLVTLISSLISLVFLESGYYLLAVLINGIFCNVTVAARSAYCYLHSKRPIVRVIAESYSVQAFPWVVLCIYASFYISYVRSISYIVLGLAVTLVFGFLSVKKIHQSHALISFRGKLKMICGDRLRIFVAFFFSEVAYHLMQYYIDSHFEQRVVADSFALLGIGILSGMVMHLIVHFNPSLKNIFTVYAAMVFLFISGYISFAYFPSSALTNFSYYLPFAGISAFGLPLIYGGFTKNVKVEEKGFLLGCLESVLSIGEFLGPILAGYNIFHFPTMILLLSISCFCMYKVSYYREIF